LPDRLALGRQCLPADRLTLNRRSSESSACGPVIQLHLSDMTAAPKRGRWLLLIHQLPKDPAYLRVKIGRRLARVGALALKNSVYVLPNGDSTLEDFQWVHREITEAGGEATVLQAEFVEGLSDEAVEARFRESKDANYAELGREARALQASIAGWSKAAPSDDERAGLLVEVTRLERRVEETSVTDFFGATGRDVVTGLLRELRNIADPPAPSAEATSQRVLRGLTWVTRQGVHVDRIASAWLIRRFIDPDAAFKFVPANGYAPMAGELRFDMYEAEYSHEGEKCTFETLLVRFDLVAPGLRAIADIVHDVDLKESRFACPETPGFAACIAGICRVYRADEDRLAYGTVLLEALYAHFSSGSAER
jgi:hypothetical protein